MLKIRYNDADLLEAGCDEAGRGALAGPVVAACVILKKDFFDERIADSKKLSPSIRYQLRQIIIDNALAWAVAFVDNHFIDKFNILNATFKAMHLALDKLSVKPDFILVDGNKFKPYKNIPFRTIVDGDDKFLSIASASILAKTFRDDFMNKLHFDFPVYGWNKNKGYPTKYHKQAILKFGLSKYHRKRFCSFYFQKSLDL